VTRLAAAPPVALLLLLSACGRREAVRAAPVDARAATAAPLGGAVLDAYRLGRRREIALSEAALRLLRCAGSAAEHAVVQEAAGAGVIAADGARATGMDLAQYTSLAARVDSLLVARRDGLGPDAGPAGGDPSLPDVVATQLDSLRVRFVVVRSRLAAEAAQPFDARAAHRGPC